MARSSITSSNNGPYILVGGLGGLAVVVGVFAFMFLAGPTGGHTSKVEISIAAPKVP